MPNFKEQLNQVSKLFQNVNIPPMPKAVMDLRAEFSKTDTPDLTELVEIIQQDPTLSAEVVKMSNKPVCLAGRLTKVQTIREAVDVIGMTRLKNTVMSMGFKMQIEGMALNEVVYFSVSVASLSAEIARYVDTVSFDEAYTAGLFHNAGCILLAQRFENYNEVFLQSLQYGYRAPAFEEKTLGASHTVSGLLVAQKRELDKRFTQIMLMHHQRDLQKISDPVTRKMIAIIQVASALIIQNDYSDYFGEEIKMMQASAVYELELEEDEIQELINILEEAY